jgi:hypothetical protein
MFHRTSEVLKNRILSFYTRNNMTNKILLALIVAGLWANVLAIVFRPTHVDNETDLSSLTSDISSIKDDMNSISGKIDTVSSNVDSMYNRTYCPNNKIC